VLLPSNSYVAGPVAYRAGDGVRDCNYTRWCVLDDRLAVDVGFKRASFRRHQCVALPCEERVEVLVAYRTGAGLLQITRDGGSASAAAGAG
jgi:hypothetical protein